MIEKMFIDVVCTIMGLFGLVVFVSLMLLFLGYADDDYWN